MRPTFGAVLALLAAPLWLACSRRPESAEAPPPASQPLSVDGAAELLEALHEFAPARERPGGEPGTAPETAPDSLTFAARLIDGEFRPVAGGSLLLTTLGDFGPREVARARSDSNGTVWLAVPGAELGSSRALFALAPGFERRFVPVQTSGVNGVVALGEVALRPGGQIRGRVVDGAQRSVARARIFLGRRASAAVESEAGLQRLHPHVELAMPFLGDESDAQGEFVLEGVPAGEWTLLVFTHPEDGELVPGYCDPVRVAAHETVRLEEILLATPAPGEVLCGTVRDPAGNPVGRAWVELHAPAPESEPTQVRTISHTDGSFTLLVPAGTSWLLEAVDREQRWPPVRSAVVVGGAVLELRFEAGPRNSK